MPLLLILLLFLLPISANAGTYQHDLYNTQPKDIISEFEAYTVSFDSQDDNNGDSKGDIWGVPEYVAYEIKKYPGSCIPTGTRPSKWMTNKDLFAQGIAPADDSYAYSKEWRTSHSNWYERGHLCMKMIAERVSNKAAYDTHYVMNAVPQRSEFNKGIWEDLEEMTAAWAQRYGEVWVITGPVFQDKTASAWLGENEKGELPVAIPDALYKIVVKLHPGKRIPDVLAFLYPQEGDGYGHRPFHHERYLTTVDAIEKLTGLDFLTALPDDVEREVESRKFSGLWPVDRGDYILACKKSN
jgi:endonuclease G, mitochondrial